ncbi:MAG: hypothetical protein R2695_10600 [Acidimicrobiales bacterium]
MTAEAPGPSSDRLASRVSDTALPALADLRAVHPRHDRHPLRHPGPDAVRQRRPRPVGHLDRGFSPYPDSIGYYDSVLVEVAIMAGLVFGATNFVALAGGDRRPRRTGATRSSAATSACSWPHPPRWSASCG